MPTLERLEKGMSNENIAAKYGVLYKLYKLGSRAKKNKRDSLEKQSNIKLQKLQVTLKWWTKLFSISS